MKKKIAACLLALLMLCSFAGCGREIPTDESGDTYELDENGLEVGASLKFWTQDVAFGEAAAKAFEEKYGIPVTVEQVGMNGMSKIMLDGPAGTGADVFVATHDSFQSGYSAGVLMEVDETIASEMKQTLQDVAVQSVTRDGKMYGIPIAVETMVMFYNKDLVEEPAQSFEQIVEEAKQWNVPEENKFRFLCQLTGYSAHAFMTAFGFELFGADGLSENPGVDSQAFLDGLTYLSTLKQTMPIDSANLSMTSGSFLDQNFYDGKTAYYINGPWFVDMLADKDINYGVAKMPTINGQPMKPFGGVQNAHVSVYTKYPKAAQCFAQFLASEECAQMLYEEASKITARKDYASIPGLCDDADLMIIAEQFTESVPMPGSERLSYFWTLTNSVYSSVFDGTLTPEQGAEKAQADFDALVKSE